MFDFKDTMVVKVDYNKQFIVTADQIDGSVATVATVAKWSQVKEILVGAHELNVPVRATPEAQRAVKRQFGL